LITYGGMAIARIAMSTESPVMVVPSTSMVPTLNVGDIVIVKGVDTNTITVGTIIIFRSPSGSIDIIHRVIGIIKQGDRLYFQTKGDHNAEQLPFEHNIKPDWVHGKVIFVVPKLGYFKVAVSKLLGGSA